MLASGEEDQRPGGQEWEGEVFLLYIRLYILNLVCVYVLSTHTELIFVKWQLETARKITSISLRFLQFNTQILNIFFSKWANILQMVECVRGPGRRGGGPRTEVGDGRPWFCPDLGRSWGSGEFHPHPLSNVGTWMISLTPLSLDIPWMLMSINFTKWKRIFRPF